MLWESWGLVISYFGCDYHKQKLKGPYSSTLEICVLQTSLKKPQRAQDLDLKVE